MKKFLCLVLALLMGTLVFAGCGKSGDAINTDAWKTMGDVLDLAVETNELAFYETVAVYAFELDGTYYRVRADLPEDVSKALWALEFDDEEYETKQHDLLAPLTISLLEVLSEQLLSDQQMKELVGKTGAELLAAGWTTGSGYNLATMEIWMNYGPFEYTVVFDGTVDESEYENFDEEEGIKDLTVKSVTFLMLGNATDIELPDNDEE